MNKALKYYFIIRGVRPLKITSRKVKKRIASQLILPEEVVSNWQVDFF